MADNFAWYELHTTDIDAAAEFYTKVIGWEAAPSDGLGAQDYRKFQMAGKGIAGLVPLADGESCPFWLGFIGVADCEASLAVAAAGGATLHPKVDYPGRGKTALVSDPQGVNYAVLQSYADQRSHAFNQGLAGHGRWNELHSPDPDGASEYYAAQYGWEKGQKFPMGPAGDYQLMQVDGVDVVGIMKAPDGAPPAWLFYFGVPDVDAAIERIAANGGAIRHGPTEVPGDGWIVQGIDPQGGNFALVGSRK